MSASTMAARTFSSADQECFASLSGDNNPMHMDPVAARRTPAGAPVVHGMHAVLWAFDTLIGANLVTRPVAALQVQFHKFIYVGVQVTLTFLRQSETALHANLTIDGMRATTLAISFGLPTLDNPGLISTEAVSTIAPAMLELSDLPGRAGWLPAIEDAPLACLFPRASEHLGAARIVALARLSTLVGMVVPGMHSIFAGLSIKIVGENNASGLSFGVQNVDEGFRNAEIAVVGSGITGIITAFIRQPPIEQRTIRDISDSVTAGAFRNTTALIVGGSRGLGALTARVLVAGGARVVITYAVGEMEAREIEREIGEEVGRDACRVLRYDARKDAAGQLGGIKWSVNQLYYFATPKIFRQKANLYVPSQFAEFCHVYVDGFHALCVALHVRGTESLSVFYPSSVALLEHPRDMTEYSMAKAAGEMLCADMKRFMPGVQVVVRRLPRMLTDQTTTMLPVQSADPLEVMLPIVWDMHLEPVDAGAGPRAEAGAL